MPNRPETFNPSESVRQITYVFGAYVRDNDQAQQHNKYGGVCAIKYKNQLKLLAQPKSIYGEPDPNPISWNITSESLTNFQTITEADLENKTKTIGDTSFLEFNIFEFNEQKIVVIQQTNPQGSCGNDVSFETPMQLIPEPSPRSDLI